MVVNIKPKPPKNFFGDLHPSVPKKKLDPLFPFFPPILLFLNHLAILFCQRVLDPIPPIVEPPKPGAPKYLSPSGKKPDRGEFPGKGKNNKNYMEKPKKYFGLYILGFFPSFLDKGFPKGYK